MTNMIFWKYFSINKSENIYNDCVSIYNSSWTDLVGLLPEVYLSTIILVALFVLANTNLKNNNGIIEKKIYITTLVYNIIFFGLIFTFIFFIVFNLSGYYQGRILFNGYTIVDTYSVVIKSAVVFTTLVIFWNSKSYIKNNPRHLMEFPILVALTCLFLLILISSYNLMTMFLGIIGFSLNIYVLLLYDSVNSYPREAGIKYYYLSTLSSGLLLSGIFFAYLIFHTTDFLQIKTKLFIWNEAGLLNNDILFLSVMMYFIIFGFLYKLAAFPCHAWAPEIYEGSPNPITALFVLPVKIATLGFFIRLLTYVFIDLYHIWGFLIWFSSIFSMLWGCFGALVEKSFKKFIAYSSINQMGFLLIGIATGTFEGTRASLIYLLIYAIMNLGLFIVFLNTNCSLTNRSLGFLTDFNYFAKSNRLYSFTLAVILFSMAGIPPLAGFFGKYYLLISAFEKELYSLVVVGLFCSLISTYYYLRIVKVMWFDKQPLEIYLIFNVTIDKTNQYIFYFLEVLLILFIFLNNTIFYYFTEITQICQNIITNI